MATATQLASNPEGDNGRAADGSPSVLATLLSHGFRPFFLGAGLYAALSIAAWFVWLGIHVAGAVVAEPTIAEPPHLWHGHEMVFGFGAAALGGFLLTAVPNWTGTERLQGSGLAIVFAAWVAGRAAMWMTALLPPEAVAAVDMTFLPLLGFLIWRKFGSRLKPRNAIFLVLVGVMAAGNGLYHGERLQWLDSGMSSGILMGLGTLVLLITIVGGRTIPGFTKNAMVRAGMEDRLPVQNGRMDAACIVSNAALFVALLLDAPGEIIGGVASVAVIANAWRFAGWRTAAILGLPIVWVLHLAYAWLILGLAMTALAHGLDIGSDVAALHAFGTGAVGTMILAIMTRASLGHSGRRLQASPATVLAYLLVTVAALLRALAPQVFPEVYLELMLASALAWGMAFALFVICFLPILITPRRGSPKPAES